jgi:hypothetical protein
MDIREFRQKYPMYDDMSDQELADKLYTKHYSDMPRADFNKSFGYSPEPSAISKGFNDAMDVLGDQKGGGGTGVGVLEAGAHAVSGLAGMLGQGVTSLGTMAYDAATGKGVDVGRANAVGAGVADALTYSPKTPQGKKFGGGLDELVHQFIEQAGNLGESIERHRQTSPAYKAREAAGNAPEDPQRKLELQASAKTAGETIGGGAMVYPLVKGGVKGVAGAMKDRSQLKQQFDAAEALRKEKEAASYPDDAMSNYDAEVMKYPMDMQAPQLGMGGRRITPEDGSIPRGSMDVVRNPFERQQDYDADIARVAEQQKAAAEAPIPYEEQVPAPKGLSLTAEGMTGPRTFEHANILERQLGPDIIRNTDRPPVNPEAGLGTPKAQEPFQITLENAKLQAEEVMKDTSIKAAVNKLAEHNKTIEELRDILRSRGVAETNLFGKDVGLSAGAAKELRPLFDRINFEIKKANELAAKVDEKFVRKVSKTPTTKYPIEKTFDGRAALKGPGKSQVGALVPDTPFTKFDPARPLNEQRALFEKHKYAAENALEYHEDTLSMITKNVGTLKEFAKGLEMTPKEAIAYVKDKVAEATKNLEDIHEQIAKIDAIEAQPKADVHTLPVKGGRPGGKQSGAVDFGLSEKLASLIRGAAKKPTSEQPVQSRGPRTGAQAIADAAHEPKTLQQWKAENPDALGKDIDSGLTDMLYKNLSNGQFTAHMNNSPVLRYANEAISDIFRKNEIAANMFKKGTIFQLKTFRGKAIEHPDSPHSIWNDLTLSDKQVLAKIANEFSGRYQLTREEIKRIGASDAVAKAYETFTKAYKDVHEAVGTGKAIPGYFALAREGDFKLSVIDKDGNTVWSDLFTNKYGAKMAMAEIKRKFPDMEFKKDAKGDPIETIGRDKGNPYNVPTIPFEELIDTLKRDDPRRSVIESVIREVKSKQGFGRHNIQRRFIAGGELTPSNFLHTFDTYVDSAMRYKTNAELKKFGNEFAHDPDIKAPNAQDYVADLVDLHRGGKDPGDFIKGVEKLAELVGKPFGFGPSFPKQAIRAANNYFMFKALFGWRPFFLVSQATQPFMFAPQWMMHYKAQGFNGSIVKAIGQGEKALIMKDAEFKTFVEDYMMKRGEIEPDLVRSMWFDNSPPALDWITGHKPAQMIEQFGRLQAAAVGYHFFKDAGLRGRELYKQSEQFVKDVMVDYNREQQPTWIPKTGILGQMAGPLTTFATNYFASVGVFLRDIGQNPTRPANWAPAIMHLAQGAIWGGLTGMFLISEADALIKLFNFLGRKAGLLDEPIQTLTERMLSSDDGEPLNDIFAFGIASWASKKLVDQGLDAGASMAAPEMRMPTANTFPGARLFWDTVANTYTALTNDTEASWKQLGKTVLPNMWGNWIDLVENGDIKEVGDMFQNPSKRMHATREIEDGDLVAKALGTKTLDQKREDFAKRSLKDYDTHVNEVKTKLIDKAVDSIEGSGESDLGELMDRARALGMDPMSFLRSVRKEVEARKRPETSRAVGRMTTPTQRRHYEQLRSFENNEND